MYTHIHKRTYIHIHTHTYLYTSLMRVRLGKRSRSTSWPDHTPLSCVQDLGNLQRVPHGGSNLRTPGKRCECPQDTSLEGTGEGTAEETEEGGNWQPCLVLVHHHTGTLILGGRGGCWSLVFPLSLSLSLSLSLTHTHTHTHHTHACMQVDMKGLPMFLMYQVMKRQPLCVHYIQEHFDQLKETERHRKGERLQTVIAESRSTPNLTDDRSMSGSCSAQLGIQSIGYEDTVPVRAYMRASISRRPDRTNVLSHDRCQRSNTVQSTLVVPSQGQFRPTGDTRLAWPNTPS